MFHLVATAPLLLQKGLVSPYHASWLQGNVSNKHGCPKQQKRTEFKKLNFSPVFEWLLKLQGSCGEGNSVIFVSRLRYVLWQRAHTENHREMSCNKSHQGLFHNSQPSKN